MYFPTRTGGRYVISFFMHYAAHLCVFIIRAIARITVVQSPWREHIDGNAVEEKPPVFAHTPVFRFPPDRFRSRRHLTTRRFSSRVVFFPTIYILFFPFCRRCAYGGDGVIYGRTLRGRQDPPRRHRRLYFFFPSLVSPRGLFAYRSPDPHPLAYRYLAFARSTRRLLAHPQGPSRARACIHVYSAVVNDRSSADGPPFFPGTHAARAHVTPLE